MRRGDVGDRLGDYELIERLGLGGMAETFVAIRRGPGGFEQTVCVKRVLPHLAHDADLTNLFIQEARLSAQLRHGNIAQVLDFGYHEGSPFLVLELIEGVDLRKLLKERELTTGIIVHIAQELAAALDYAHNEGLVHRDISPSNVLVSRAGEIKLADFGIAKALGNTGFARTGVVKGKVPYMAPEYARHGRYDPRSDIFSLGVLLYELVARRRPFDGPNDAVTLQNLTSGKHPPLGEAAPDANAEFAAAIERCIAVEPDDRFASARALRDALADLAPPATARRILGKVVRSVQRRSGQVPRKPKHEPKPPLADGTALLTATPAPADEQPTPAHSDSVTRTRARVGTQTELAGPPTIFEPGTAAEPRTRFDPRASQALPTVIDRPPKITPTALWIALGVAIAVAVGATLLLLL